VCRWRTPSIFISSHKPGASEVRRWNITSPASSAAERAVSDTVVHTVEEDKACRRPRLLRRPNNRYLHIDILPYLRSMSTRNNLAQHLTWLQREKPFIPPPPREPRPINEEPSVVAIPGASVPQPLPTSQRRAPPPPHPHRPPQTAPPANSPVASLSAPLRRTPQPLVPPPLRSQYREEDIAADEMAGALQLSSSVRPKRSKLGCYATDSYPESERPAPAAKSVLGTPAIGSLSRESSRTETNTGMGCAAVTIWTLLIFPEQPD